MRPVAFQEGDGLRAKVLTLVDLPRQQHRQRAVARFAAQSSPAGAQR